MVMKSEPVVTAVRSVREQEPENPGRLLLMSPAGRVFDQAFAYELSLSPRLIIVAGHYEGYDERISEILQPDLISIGDYVLTGGELPALVIVDAVVRLLPGVLGHEHSILAESFAPGNNGLLEYPQYTRPAVYRGLKVPPVLLSGDHKKIEFWRQKEAYKRTLKRRPDLLRKS